MIYVVDDDDAVRDSLTLLLESHGFAVAGFASAAEFVATREPCDKGCLILDHHLPGTSGLDFLASPAADGIGVPVILITGGANPVIRNRAAALGVAAFFEKPVTEEPLLDAIAAALGGAA